ncbi:MAG: hypothetical protein NZ484_00750 [Patescibacteria group bacterium]|nr:hypothetical protein [Patescibacteria group bacterium]MDW8279750.1 hypothetical protein [bacterium]
MKYVLTFVLIIIIIAFLFSIGLFKNLQLKNFNFLKYIFPTSTYNYMSFYGNRNNTSTYLGRIRFNNNSHLNNFNESEVSPYAGKVFIEDIKIYGNQGQKYEEIILSVRGLQNQQKINISGWSLFSNKSNFIITFGLKNLDFSKVFKESSIVLENNYKVKIYSTHSPIGVNFELNKCSGYLNEFYNFVPNLPKNCPKIEKKEIAHLSGLCQDFILGLKTCEVPNQLRIIDNDPACLNYLKNINYQGCFDKNKNKFDFYTKEWLIFMNKEILDDLHDRVLLYDNKGLIVDEYIY